MHSPRPSLVHTASNSDGKVSTGSGSNDAGLNLALINYPSIETIYYLFEFVQYLFWQAPNLSCTAGQDLELVQ